MKPTQTRPTQTAKPAVPAVQQPKPYSPPSTIMAPERAAPSQPKQTAHHDPLHLVGRFERWRGVALGGIAGMGIGILMTLFVVDRTTVAQTTATVEAFGQGVATGTALPKEDKINYGDDFGHQPTKKPYREPK